MKSVEIYKINEIFMNKVVLQAPEKYPNAKWLFAKRDKAEKDVFENLSKKAGSVEANGIKNSILEIAKTMSESIFTIKQRIDALEAIEKISERIKSII